MILLDADVLLLDIRYPRDVRFATNERLLRTLQERTLEQRSYHMTARDLFPPCLSVCSPQQPSSR
jgi:hypothetical protein